MLVYMGVPPFFILSTDGSPETRKAKMSCAAGGVENCFPIAPPV